MLGYILRRILAVIPVMLLVAVFVFLLLRLTPGDPAAIIAGDMATPAQLERIREAMGLNDPLHIQFVTWVGQLLRGDLGVSLISNTPVATMVADRIAPTLSIAVLTIVMSVAIAVPMGVLAAWKHRSMADYAVMTFSVLGFSVPVFVIGYLFILVFSLQLGWFPVQGYTPLSSGLGGFLSNAFLPALTLSTIYVALIARMTRANMLEVLGEDYIRTARAKGAPERTVLFRHALKNAAVPILTVIGTGFALLIGGVVVTETVFNIPGVGRLTVDAILARDYPVIQAMILLTSFLYVLVNLLIDLSYSLFDPRIRY
ncbi:MULTISPECIES: ABC transporter permease [Paracoccus]|jgi:peptide/nickel transport system permease protein|uniref:ABC transporter permease n=2 Tax=Paracoccus TaxID=265 RepID=A0A5C4R5E1_9RHOB|nr:MULTISPECIES: ABC transporter permease [Paracoccus]TYP60777.1 peptide/nickel transport system permease protein [Stutzerimonas stutzeri]KJZ32110.1 peptide ABC transporter [Paracoccus sp. S4493]MBF5078465.1 ABC transporter permease [Paracoccus sp. NBH48]MCO6361711.1 ABC transporter permease subunit [Paracoccus sp. 08]QXI63583.1 Glutathione transport system permease protein GsiC [Paracoccus marcusii]